MQEIFEKIKERLEEEREVYYDRYCRHGDDYDNGSVTSYGNAINIVNQVAEEYKNDIFNQIAEIYAGGLEKYGVDVTEKWETATQNVFAMEQAYLRGRQDERSKFDEWREEYGKDINVPGNDGWIPVSSEELPTEYETVLCVTDAEYGGYYYVAVYTSEHGFRTEEDYVNGELIAWKPIKPYQPKGE